MKNSEPTLPNMFLPLLPWQRDFSCEGLLYTVLDEAAGRCMIASGNTAEGHVVIPSVVSDGRLPYTVSAIGECAFYGCDKLLSVEIPDSVTVIGTRAFFGCVNLTVLTFPLSLLTIGDFAFYKCDGLLSLNIPSSVSNIGTNAFGHCKSLMKIEVAEDNSVYMSCDGILFDRTCSKLIRFPAVRKGFFNVPATVTIIGNEAFSDCTGLTSVRIPSSVTVIGPYAFCGCRSLESIELSASVTLGEGAFAHCDNLRRILIYPRSLSESPQK